MNVFPQSYLSLIDGAKLVRAASVSDVHPSTETTLKIEKLIYYQRYAESIGCDVKSFDIV
jgi:hypothetical protein